MIDIVYGGGYFLSMISFLLLSILFSFVPNKNVVTQSLVFCCICCSLWGGGNTWLLFYTSGASDVSFLAIESVRLLGLLALLLALLSVRPKLKQILVSPQFLTIFLLLATATGLLFLQSQYKQLSYTLLLSVIIFLLILIETIFSKAKQKLSALKPMILCLFTILIVDFILFAEGALFLQLETNLLIAKSYVGFLLAPLLLWSIRRTTELQVKVYISREVLLQSTVVLGAGVYLGALALVGFYIKQFEQAWTPILQIVFIILGFVLLIAVLMSHSLKANLKIFIQKNFFANKFDYRAQWLALTEELRKTNDPYANATSTLRLALNAKAVKLLKYGNEKLYGIGDSWQPSAEALQEVSSLLPRVKLGLAAIDINNEIGLATLVSHQIDWIVPIDDGDSLWGLALVSQNPAEFLEMDWEVSEYLHVVSVQIAHYLFQHEANEQIMENAQFSAFSRMSAFVLHDLKNILAQIQMIVSNAEKHRNNPDFIDDTFETLTHSKSRLDKVIKQLKDKKVNSASLQLINVVAALTHLTKTRFKQQDNLVLELIPKQAFIRADEDRFCNVLCHIIDNALEASGHKDKVLIKAEVDYDRVIITVEDSGAGMSEQFIKDKLFKPFETTKGNAGMGIGAYDAKMFTEALGGEVSVTSAVNEGTKFVLSIPAEQN